MNSPRPTISVSNISKRFGDIDAVTDFTVQLHPGEIVGFVGPNGAGKTTTISILMGFISPDKGIVKIHGKPVTPRIAHTAHRRIGFVSGDMTLPRTLSGERYLSFMAKQNGRDQKRYDALVTKLSPVLDRPTETLSRGNKQKLALIAALQHAPDILILDEPTSGLDPLMQDLFLNAIKQEAKQGASVLMSSHILGEVASISSRIVFMKSGKKILDKPVSQIITKLGKQVTVISKQAVKIAQFVPADCEIIRQSATTLQLSVPSSNMPAFLRWLVTKDFDDITIEERDLDEIFHELYIEKGRR